MTTAINTVARRQQATPPSFVRRAGALLSTVAAMLEAWSLSAREAVELPDSSHALATSERIEAALRWHARHDRVI